jgi:hypothetical protein
VRRRFHLSHAPDHDLGSHLLIDTATTQVAIRNRHDLNHDADASLPIPISRLFGDIYVELVALG